ncbi:hypothetical protein VIBNIMADA3021_1210068 [Vibrio nigripulchritudo MADA3021]|nr:hypothetical protein VIBNIMADA3021_1210068 [Vibrio nigripulchritudo MADA3021]
MGKKTPKPPLAIVCLMDIVIFFCDNTPKIQPPKTQGITCLLKILMANSFLKLFDQKLQRV